MTREYNVSNGKVGFGNADNVHRQNLLKQVHACAKEGHGDDYSDTVEHGEESIMKDDPEGSDGIPFADDGEPVKHDPDDKDNGIPYA